MASRRWDSPHSLQSDSENARATSSIVNAAHAALRQHTADAKQSTSGFGRPQSNCQQNSSPLHQSARIPKITLTIEDDTENMPLMTLSHKASRNMRFEGEAKLFTAYASVPDSSPRKLALLKSSNPDNMAKQWRQACCKAEARNDSLRHYPFVFLPTVNTLVVFMLGPPTEKEIVWPSMDKDKTHYIRLQHHAFYVTLHVSSDELDYSFALGPFIECLRPPQRVSFFRQAKELLDVGRQGGMNTFLGAVLFLEPLAHTAQQMAVEKDGIMSRSSWLPDVVELREHWKICEKQGWTCHQVL